MWEVVGSTQESALPQMMSQASTRDNNVNSTSVLTARGDESGRAEGCKASQVDIQQKPCREHLFNSNEDVFIKKDDTQSE